jgi:hypothetical protein
MGSGSQHMYGWVKLERTGAIPACESYYESGRLIAARHNKKIVDSFDEQISLVK